MLSGSDKKWILDLFEYIDSKHDGYLDASEMQSAFEKVGRTEVTYETVRCWLKQNTCINRPGKLSRTEFMKNMLSHATQHGGSISCPPFEALYSRSGLLKLQSSAQGPSQKSSGETRTASTTRTGYEASGSLAVGPLPFQVNTTEVSSHGPSQTQAVAAVGRDRVDHSKLKTLTLLWNRRGRYAASTNGASPGVSMRWPAQAD